MASADARFHPDLLRQSVLGLRSQLRDSDLVGTLTESEIAVLLSETDAAAADAVIRRLRLPDSTDEHGKLEHFAVGVVTRAGDWPSGISVVGAARDAARRHESGAERGI
jgi:hypothetical protein